MIISDNIKALRKAHGLSQRDFAKKCSLSQSAISQFEAEDRIPSMVSLQAISKAFGVPINYLLNEEKIDKSSGKEMIISAIANKLRELPEAYVISLHYLVERN